MLNVTILIFLCMTMTEGGFLLDILQSPDYINCFLKCDKDTPGCAQVIFESSEISDLCAISFQNSEVQDCMGSDSWSEPPNWTAGQPDLFLGFQNPACLTFEHENPQLYVSFDGLGLYFNKKELMGASRFVYLDPDVVPTCLINPDTCNPGFTISFWIKISSGCKNQYGILSSKKYMSKEGPQSYGMRMMCYVNNTLRVHVFGSLQYARTTSSVSYQEDTWFKYTIVFTNTWQIASYFNSQSVGEQHANALSTAKLSNDGVFLIGKKWTNRNYAYGRFQMDSFFVMEQVLSEDLIQLI